MVVNSLYTLTTVHWYSYLQKEPNHIISNWMDTLLSYSFDLVHCPGIDNVFPDAPSRAYPTLKTLSTAPPSSVAIPSQDFTDLSPISNLAQREQLLLQGHLRGHFGVKSIVGVIHALGFSWSSLRSDAATLVKNCHICQQYNIGHHGFHPLTPLSARLPMNHLPWTSPASGILLFSWG